MQLHQQVESFLHLFTICETRPIMLMYFSGGKTVTKFPCAKLGQNSARGGSFRLIGGSVQTTGVGFEIFAEGKRFAHRPLGDFIVSVVDQMVDQRERRYQFPIFREVGFERCGILSVRNRRSRSLRQFKKSSCAAAPSRTNGTLS